MGVLGRNGPSEWKLFRSLPPPPLLVDVLHPLPCSIMSVHLSAPDLARLEAASRVLVSPLTSPTIDAWRSSVNSAVGELFRAHKTLMMLPGYGDLYNTETAPDVVERMRDYVELAATGDHVVKDPVVDLWHRLRRRQHVDVFSWAINAQMIGQFGYPMEASEFTNYTVVETGSKDFLGVYTTVPEGEVLLWVLLERSDVHPFGEDAAMLMRALLPSFNAGLDAISRYNAHRQTLDAVSEPLIVFGRGGVERYRNTAFVQMLDAEAEREKIMMEVMRLAISVQPFGMVPSSTVPLSSPFAAPQRTLRTTSASYDLRASVVGPNMFDSETAVIITLTRQGPPALPSAGNLRDRFGLTAREAEVAILLAEGLSNSEIAERLFLSPHTARRHTANIFGKLDVTSRKALALRFLCQTFIAG